ncbi:MAG TPA: aminotransferase class V-fold PLP-dependent enzyme [Micromonosporaceae bacterium]|jgi:cysteine desulfurase
MDREVNLPGAARSFFDAAAGAPLRPVAASALVAATADGWADPSKLYLEGRRAAQLVDAARAVIAETLDVRPAEVTFTTSGSRAAELAIAGARAGRARVGDTVVHSAIEHSSVLRAAGSGSAVGVPVDRLGRLDLEAFASAVAAPGVAVAAVQSANHEVGTEQPIAEAAELAGDVPLYVDAAQSLGHAPIPPGWSLLSASAAKWGGPVGVGVLVVRPGVRFAKPWPVERVDPEPISIPLVVAAAAALRVTSSADSARLTALTSRIRSQVAATVPDVEVVGDPDRRLPHIVTFSCLYVDGEALLHALDRHGFAVSSGSSCTASTLQPSHVLTAMGVLSHGNVRVSLHDGSTSEEVERFLAVLPGVVADLRAEAGVSGL